MVDWQLTATSIYCDAVDDDVTIIVNGDRTTRCTGYVKYVEKHNKDNEATLKAKSKKLGRKIACEGPLDHRVTDYRDKLFAEDSEKTV
jgi:hypothetical protein